MDSTISSAVVPAPGAISNGQAEKVRLVERLSMLHDFFASNVTKDVAFRIAQLKRLKNSIEVHEKDILNALQTDLHKHEFEAYGTEIGLVLAEIDKCIKYLPTWAKRRPVSTPILFFKANSYILPEPYGVSLVISPWNYPFQLALLPLVGAIAAGNCVALKPSELAPHTSAIIATIIGEAFESRFVQVFEGDASMSQALLRQKFDFIFFTGSTQVGRIVYEHAARHLTPVVLELGGKSPCVVLPDADINVTAKRLLWGKIINAGQTCIAPDYVYVHSSVKKALVTALAKYVEDFLGKQPSKSPYYARIVNDRHYERLVKLMNGSGKIILGGETIASERFIAPTLIESPSADAPIMQEEIFGPLLPILEYERLDEVISFVKARPKPLAFYVFGKHQRSIDRLMNEVSFGGGGINNTLMHIGNPHMSFGGVGDSGVGGYHGKHSFECFSHLKGVMDRSTLIDAPVWYPPYKVPLALLRSLMKRLV